MVSSCMLSHTKDRHLNIKYKISMFLYKECNRHDWAMAFLTSQGVALGHPCIRTCQCLPDMRQPTEFWELFSLEIR